MNKEHEHDELKELLDEGFRSIDLRIDESTPSHQWFEQFAADQHEQLKAKFKRDLVVFILLACCILTTFSLTLFQMPILFLLLQVAVFVGASIYTGRTYMKRVKRI
jgi:uncharacterized membrane protein